MKVIPSRKIIKIINTRKIIKTLYTRKSFFVCKIINTRKSKILTITYNTHKGFTRLWPSFFTLCAMVLSVVLLGIAMKSLPVGTSYAVWVGIGAVGTSILGMVLFGEPATLGRLGSLGLIVAGIVGLKLASSG